MNELRRYCEKCQKAMPLNWNQSHCRTCGGRITLSFVERSNWKPRSAHKISATKEQAVEPTAHIPPERTTDSVTEPTVPIPQERASRSTAEPTAQIPHEMTTDSEAVPTVPIRQERATRPTIEQTAQITQERAAISAANPTATEATVETTKEKSERSARFFDKPTVLFLSIIVTLGAASVIWFIRRIEWFDSMAAPDESTVKGRVRFWLLSNCLFIVSFILSAWLYLVVQSGEALLSSWPFMLSACLFAINALTARYFYFWICNVVSETLYQSGDDDAFSGKGAFAASPMFIWFVGAPYIQHQLNKIYGVGQYTPA